MTIPFLHKPKIRTVLLSVNMAVLLLPLAGIWGFRLYETELIRRTEAELISQTVLLKEVFLREYGRLNASDLEKEMLLGPVIDRSFQDLNRVQSGQFRKIYPRLDISRERKRDPIVAPEIPGPIFNKQLEAIGKELNNLIRNAQFSLLSGIRIVDANATVIASTTAITGQSLYDREEVRRALGGEPLSLIRRRAQQDLPTHSILSYGTGVIVFVAQPIVFNGRILGAVVAARTPMNLANAVYEHRHHLMRFIIILLTMVLLAATLTAATIGGPIRKLAAMTVSGRKGRPGRIQPLKRPGTAEVAALSETFAAISNAMHERADYNEGLVRSISHEFKTPIASINASVEILEDHLDSMTAEEKKKFLTMISKDSLRLQRLVERLLELARADAIMNPAGDCQPEPVLKELRDYFTKQCGSLDLQLQDDIKNCKIAMPRDVFHSCISNVIHNSIVHNTNTSKSINIKVTCRVIDNQLQVSIADDGSGIDPLDRHKIFDPFFTTARDKGGTGLGLSILKSLVEAYLGKVVLGTPSSGADISLWIPIKS